MRQAVRHEPHADHACIKGIVASLGAACKQFFGNAASALSLALIALAPVPADSPS